jgi:hypothetical protein
MILQHTIQAAHTDTPVALVSLSDAAFISASHYGLSIWSSLLASDWKLTLSEPIRDPAFGISVDPNYNWIFLLRDNRLRVFERLKDGSVLPKTVQRHSNTVNSLVATRSHVVVSEESKTEKLLSFIDLNGLRDVVKGSVRSTQSSDPAIQSKTFEMKVDASVKAMCAFETLNFSWLITTADTTMKLWQVPNTLKRGEFEPKLVASVSS